MPLLIYERTDRGEARQFRCLREVKLAGKRGPIAAIARRHLAEGRRAWDASAAEVVGRIEGAHPGQELVFDLKPNVKGNVSLYRLDHIWGYCHDRYTPLCLRLECLFHDRQIPDPKAFKLAFDDRNFNHSFLTEFLYLNGGTRSDNWTWGLVGRVNGALIWREAFEHFATALRDRLTDRDRAES